MRFESLAYFLEVARCGSLTAASKRLFVSQQGLSKSVKALERELGCTLFERDGAGVSLTDAGRALMPLARQCLDAKEELKRVMEPHANRTAGNASFGEALTLHAMPFVTDSLFSLLDDELSRWGLSDLVIIEEDYPDIVAGLDDARSSKIAAVCLPSREHVALLENENVEFRLLFETELVLLGAASLMPAGKTSFSAREIACMPVAYYNDQVLNGLVAELFSTHPLRNVVNHASNQARIASYLTSGKAVTFSDSLSVFLGQERSDLVVATIRDAAPFAVGFAYARRGMADERQLAYVDRFEQCFKTRCGDYLAQRADAKRANAARLPA